MKKVMEYFFILICLSIGMSCQNKKAGSSLSNKSVKMVKSDSEEKAENIETLFCDETNYEDYTHNPIKTKQLIKQTGEGCQLENADLSGKSFHFATLRKANLRGVNCRACDFRNADLYGVTVHGANLTNADFRNANLIFIYGFTKANLKGAVYDEDTEKVFWFQPKLHGMTFLCDDGKPPRGLLGCILRGKN